MLPLPYLDVYAEIHSIDLAAATNVPEGTLCSLAVLKAQSQTLTRGKLIRTPNYNDGKN